MFVPTDGQRSLLECEFLLPPAKVNRLKKSWAEPFRERILPLIDEEVFRDAYDQANGRPNTSIRLLVGLHLLKDWNDLTDEQMLEHLEFNLQWHYALGVESGSAHVCEKTLHNFRHKLMGNDRAQALFERVTRALAEADGVGLGRQRLDSTHVISNIAVLTRLGLFVETVTHFLKVVRQEAPDVFSTLNAGYAHRYLDREGYFSDAKREQARRRLPVVAQDAYDLVRVCENEAPVSGLPAFGLLKRLVDEQCEVVEPGGNDHGDQGPGDGEGGVQTGGPKVRLREPKTVASDSLQSPHDPDATYGHKGKGYEVQVAETCGDGNPYQIVTAVAVNGAHESDQKALLPMVEQLAASEMLPQTLLADTGYGSGANIVGCAERGVDLLAPVQDPHAPAPPEQFAQAIAQEVEAPAEPQAQATGSEAGAVGPKTAEQDSPAKPLGLNAFWFDFTCHEITACPGGQVPVSQHLAGGQMIADFPSTACGACPLASTCPIRELACGDRQLRRSPAVIATEIRQEEQQGAAFKELYRKRSGVESTNEELKGRHGLGGLRVRCRPRVALAAWLKALALNVKRAAKYHAAKIRAAVAASCPCPA